MYVTAFASGHGAVVELTDSAFVAYSRGEPRWGFSE